MLHDNGDLPWIKQAGAFRPAGVCQVGGELAVALNPYVLKRKNMGKDAPAGSQLYYGQIRVHDTVSFEKVCAKIASLSTASKGDVQIVIAGLLEVLREHLEAGHTVQLGEPGNFRMTAGSRGAEEKGDFNTSYFKKGRVKFFPGSLLRDLENKVNFDLLRTIEKECDKLHDEQES
jgi:predicted histone-like DNA-binding protein